MWEANRKLAPSHASLHRKLSVQYRSAGIGGLEHTTFTLRVMTDER